MKRRFGTETAPRGAARGGMTHARGRVDDLSILELGAEDAVGLA
jgi:hypothetical protein